LQQVGDLFELNVKLWCQKVNMARFMPFSSPLLNGISDQTFRPISSL